MLISACMIVKNEQSMLAKTLPNLVNLVDEVVLVDTGSTDDTKSIAQKYGAKVHDFSWINDFSAARNESLKYAQGEWVIWVDADEFIKPEDMEKIKGVLRDSKEIGYLLKVSECREGEFNPISFNYRPKIFKNKIGIHFERPINEQPYASDGKSVFDFSPQLDIPIYHWGGFLDENKTKLKKMRNIEIFKRTVASGKGDASVHFLLGMNYRDLKMYDESIKEFDEVLKIADSDRFRVAARSEKAWILYNSNKIKEAYVEAVEALKIDKENSSAWNIVGAVFIAMGEYEKAAETLKGSAEIAIKPDALIVNLRQKDYLANLLLSKAYLKLNKKKEAFEAAKKAYSFDPTDEAKKAMDDSSK